MGMFPLSGAHSYLSAAFSNPLVFYLLSDFGCCVVGMLE